VLPRRLLGVWLRSGTRTSRTYTSHLKMCTTINKTPLYISYAHDGPGKLQDHEKAPRKIVPLNFRSDFEGCRNAPPFKYFEATCFNQNPPSKRTFATGKVVRIEMNPWESNGIFYHLPSVVNFCFSGAVALLQVNPPHSLVDPHQCLHLHNQ
jgi:hypothetical protein